MTRSVFKSFRYLALGVLGAGLVLVPMIPRAHAELGNERTVIKFSGPVEIPGRVLPAGTYVLQLADFSSNRCVVQVFTQDQKKVLATELTIPVYRMNPTSKTVITFEERAANSPPAVHDWFYPGMVSGHEFIYHR